MIVIVMIIVVIMIVVITIIVIIRIVVMIVIVAIVIITIVIITIFFALVHLLLISDDHAVDSPDIILIFCCAGVELHLVYDRAVFTVELHRGVQCLRPGDAGMGKCDCQRFFF